MISNLADESLPGSCQMSELGHSRHFDDVRVTSGLPRSTDIVWLNRLVPIGDMLAMKLRSNHREIPINRRELLQTG